MPRATKALLGQSHNFIPTPKVTPHGDKIEAGLERLERDVHLKTFFAGQPLDPSEQPKLYIKSTWRPPPYAIPAEVDRRLHNFRKSIHRLYRKSYGKPNLLPFQRRLMAKLRKQFQYLVGKTDKGLGPFVIEFARYAELGINLLSDQTIYRLISEQEAQALVQQSITSVLSWISKFRKALDDDSALYIQKRTSAASEDPFGYLYLMIKVHKKGPGLSVRPVVSDCSSVINALGKWVDIQLQPIAQGMATYFKDSYTFKETMLDTFDLRPGDRIFTSDAVGMYQNIDTDTAMLTISQHLRDINTKTQYPHYNAEALIAALEIVMRNNIFRFGDLYCKQESGTAMGTPPAPPWATIFEGLKEESAILPRFGSNLPFYKRFLDDIFAVWRCIAATQDEDNQQWLDYKALLNDGCLEWICSERGEKVDFMDLTISIVNNEFKTSLFEKPMSLFLYIPPHSAHPPGVLTGHIFGEVLRINRLCSDSDDITQRIRIFFRRLMRRAHKPSKLLPLFKQAMANAKKYLATSEEEKAAQREKKRSDAQRRVYFHQEFHPQGPKAREIQSLFETHVLNPPGQEPFNRVGFGGSDIPLDALVVANHRPLNLGDLFSYRKINKRNGPPVSSFMK